MLNLNLGSIWIKFVLVMLYLNLSSFEAFANFNFYEFWLCVDEFSILSFDIWASKNISWRYCSFIPSIILASISTFLLRIWCSPAALPVFVNKQFAFSKLVSLTWFSGFWLFKISTATTISCEEESTFYCQHLKVLHSSVKRLQHEHCYV